MLIPILIYSAIWIAAGFLAGILIWVGLLVRRRWGQKKPSDAAGTEAAQASESKAGAAKSGQVLGAFGPDKNSTELANPSR